MTTTPAGRKWVLGNKLGPSRAGDTMKTGNYHLVGIAGVGMSAIARALVAVGCQVSGSDRFHDQGQSLEVLNKLANVGVKILPQDGSGISSSSTGLVVSTAIEDDNPDIAAAGRHNVPVLHRAEMLARIVEGRECIAVAGTSGKSTVTGIIGFILEQLGADPFVINGAPVLNWMNRDEIGNVRPGQSKWCVIEVDESDRSLLNFHPQWALITNISADHFTLEESLDLFREFSVQVASDVLEGDAESFDPQLEASASRFEYGGLSFTLNLPGRHNAENAMNAVAMCVRLGFQPTEIAKVLPEFKGIHRRLEVVGQTDGILVIDDYAHNPAKISATWETLAPYHQKVLAVWRPHGYRPLSSMMDDLVATFRQVCRPSDFLAVLPVFDAGGTANRSVSSEMLVKKLRTHGLPAAAVKNYDEAIETLCEKAKPGSTVITMGARDPHLPELARNILRKIGGDQ
jgi:UDP-N-acetylmuramate--alanine ligase